MSTDNEQLKSLRAEVASLQAQVEELQREMVSHAIILKTGVVIKDALFGTLQCSTIKCSAIQVTDHLNTVRVEISAEEGVAGIRLMDDEGNLRVTAQTLDTGSAGVVLWDRHGTMRVILDTDIDGNPKLHIGALPDDDD